jgi:hypothetical protein
MARVRRRGFRHAIKCRQFETAEDEALTFLPSIARIGLPFAASVKRAPVVISDRSSHKNCVSIRRPWEVQFHKKGPAQELH